MLFWHAHHISIFSKISMHCFYSEITLNSLNSCSVFFLRILTNFFDVNKLFQYWFCKIIWRYSGSVLKYSGWSARARKWSSSLLYIFQKVGSLQLCCKKEFDLLWSAQNLDFQSDFLWFCVISEPFAEKSEYAFYFLHGFDYVKSLFENWSQAFKSFRPWNFQVLTYL